MELDNATWVAVSASIFLFASASWANLRFAEYDRLPRQFDLAFKPKSFAPRWVMVWLLPSILVVTLALIVFLPQIVPPELVNGDPKHGIVIASVAVVGVQIFTLWLLTRWARQKT